ncbi:MAG: ABC-F family ATP-binding cassette domain-containing protein [Chloroflexi bacterium]|nr:ABC-F family ATP-binding cassette domain-containing protein [Chloroflexota bacterium]
MPLVSATELAVAYGVDEVFAGVNLEISERAHIGIVGPNGSGKTSLLKLLVEELEPSAGTVHWTRGVQVGYVPQIPRSMTNGSLSDEVMTAFDRLHTLEKEIEAGALELQRADAGARDEAEARYAAVVEEYELLGGYSYESSMERMVAGLGLSKETLSARSSQVSGGERTRAALARALLANPDLLVLDEPTNHLDLKGLAWLENYLTHFTGAFVVVSHDRYFLDRTVTQVWEMDHGELQTFPGNYSKYRILKAERNLRQEREFAKQQEYIAKEEDFIRRYHAGQRAREAKGRATRLQRLKRVQAPERDRTIGLSGVTASRTGQVVISTNNLKVGYVQTTGATELLTVPNLQLERGSRTAIIGDNGTGKTTLLKTLQGLIPPLAGTATLGHNVKVGYYIQGLDDLPEESTVIEAFLQAKGMSPEEARSYLARFLFQGEDVFRRVADCSGGERSRLALARLLIAQPNLLILDEPTTHLDIASREAFELVLLDYAGALLFVSHDRQFVSLLAQTLWVIDQGKVTPFADTFEMWMQSISEPVSQTPRPAKPKPPRTVRAAKINPRATPEEDPVLAIDKLESRLVEIERLLEQASGRQDVEAISRLGEEYELTRSELAQKMDRWGR